MVSLKTEQILSAIFLPLAFSVVLLYLFPMLETLTCIVVPDF